MSEEEDDIILSELDDDDLVAQMFDDLYDGLKEEIEEGVNILLERGWTPYDILTKALVGGMTIVGNDFRDGILFVPEVLMAANAMKGGMAILKPLLVETGAPRIGKMVIGTVKGDIHDIGKNLVSMMMEGAGFEVVDLGINNAVENYLEALETEQPDILGMSALLTTTMPYMKVVIDTLNEKGIRDDYIVLVGGAPLNEEFGKAIGADAYCRDAAVAVETAKEFVARKHNQMAARACARASCTTIPTSIRNGGSTSLAWPGPGGGTGSRRSWCGPVRRRPRAWVAPKSGSWPTRPTWRNAST
jgi:methylmalonyl-CoA mutase cobalamin-binding domain/chain